MPQNLYDQARFFESYQELRANPANYNDLLEQPALRRLLPALQGKDVLDLGCGAGGTCRYLLERGAASVTGIDLSARMIAQAKQDSSADIRFLCMPMEALGELGLTFDLVVSSLALHYVQDYPSLLRAVFAALRPGGTFVFSQEHPLTTAPRHGARWLADAQEGRYYPLTDYGRPGQRRTAWMGAQVEKYHRSFSELVSGLLQAGFRLSAMREPLPGQEALRKNPRMAKEFDKPSFLLLRAEKPAFQEKQG